eukprot:COSAG03_NODE_107_length_12621_cov_360.337087_7_plen_116_part_00
MRSSGIEAGSRRGPRARAGANKGDLIVAGGRAGAVLRACVTDVSAVFMLREPTPYSCSSSTRTSTRASEGRTSRRASDSLREGRLFIVRDATFIERVREGAEAIGHLEGRRTHVV